MTQAEYLAGRLLLAMPGMGDTRFDRSVIALCTHDQNGAFGIGVGHLRDSTTFYDLLDELDIDPGVAADCPVHHGGPVEPGRGFILHSRDWREDQTLDAGPLGLLSGSLEAIKAITEGRGPQRWLMALGFAGWAPGQLDNEMRHHGWFSAASHDEVLWQIPAEQRWTAAWRAEGIDPALLVSQTGTA